MVRDRGSCTALALLAAHPHPIVRPRATESVMVGFFGLITAKDEKPPRPYGRAGEQDAVFLGFSRDGFHWHRPNVHETSKSTSNRRTPFLPMSTTKDDWNFLNVQGVGGGFLVIDGASQNRSQGQLQFYVGARSGTCDGCDHCTKKHLRVNWVVRLIGNSSINFLSIIPAC